MDCSDFVARFTDYLDGVSSQEETLAMDRHLAECPGCRRYKLVVERGAELLRELPEPELRDDFAPRLQHRLYHLEDERVVREQVTSGAPAFTVLGIALLLTAVAWAPAMRGGRAAGTFEPVAIERAPASSAQSAAPSRPVRGDLTLERYGGLWENTLLYEYSPLSRGYEGVPRTRQVGLAPRR